MERRHYSGASGSVSARKLPIHDRQIEARQLIIGCAGLFLSPYYSAALKIYRSRHGQKFSQQRHLSCCCVMFFTD